MSAINFDEYVTPPLTFNFRGKTYTVPPPTRENGLNMTVLLTVGANAYVSATEKCPSCGQTPKDNKIPKKVRDITERMENMDLADITLTPGVHKRLVKDEVPESDIDRMALYALYYWSLGKDSADQIAKSMWTPEGVRKAQEEQQAPKA